MNPEGMIDGQIPSGFLHCLKEQSSLRHLQKCLST